MVYHDCPKCSGSFLIRLKNGKYVPCACRFVYKANLVFGRSAAPVQYKKFLNELEENPTVKNITKLKLFESKMKRGEITEEQYRELEKTVYVALHDVLKQFLENGEKRNLDFFIENNYKLVFQGRTRTGKTQAAITLAFEAAKQYKEFYYISCQNLHRLFRYNFNSEEDVKRVDEAKRRIEESEILILDDLGKEIDALDLKNEKDLRLGKEMLNFLDSTLRSKNRLVIVTTNYRFDELKKLYEPLDVRFYAVLSEKALVYLFHEKIAELKQEENAEFLFSLL